MARAASVVVAAALVVVGLASVAAAQMDSCNGELPPVLAANYSGLACQSVWNNFVLRYHQDKNNVLRIVLSTMYSTGWVGMGFSRDGLMIGSSATRCAARPAPRSSSTAASSSPTTTTTPSSCSRPRSTSLSNSSSRTASPTSTSSWPSATASPSRTSSPFTRTRPHSPSISRRVPNRHQLTSRMDREKQSSFLLPVSKSSVSEYSSSIPNFQIPNSGRASVDGSFPYGLRRAHGALNVFAWGVLMPIGAILARYFRRVDPLWFYLHIGIQFVGFIIGLAGVVAGVALYNKIQADVPAHRGLGIFVLFLGILQILAFFLRPNPDSKYRKYWNWYHQWAGRLALFFAAVNIVLGIHVGGADNSWKIGYGFNLAVILVAVIALEFMLWTRWSKNSTSTRTY